jgi:group I intron endonuclease
MFYLIYKITNNINNKIYIGSHKTKEVNDGYMGSGKRLIQSIKKYGIENFSKEILFSYDNSKDMYTKEAELVNEEFVKDNNTYNLKVGGFGGFDYINSKKLNNKSNQCSKAGKAASINGKGFKGRTHTPEVKKHLSEVLTGRPPTFLGRVHSIETKQLMREKHLGLGSGEKNSQFGTCWITDGTHNKKIKKEQLDKYLNLGYNKGRKL